jgi:plasmid segregation protein ParM
MIIRAIDVGYGNTKFCHGDKGCDHFPSIATLTMKSGIGLSAGGTIKRDVIEVESDGSNYLVGKDGIETLSARDDRGRFLNASYAETAQHLALFRGALTYLDVPEIDVIVSGLPVKNYTKNTT